ncbi:acyl carrier protein [Inquilinus sp. OTU3971]|uniref:acyl carrier protein n=1 Tax=Inquilinus sp. OTU3971 TaxID=3043855 RepID=UPI00313E7002
MRAEIERVLLEHIAREHLDGDLSELDVQTPLLGLKILNSLAVIKLLAFVTRQFGVVVPAEQITAANLQSIAAIVNLVLMLGAKPMARGSTETTDLE